MYTQDMEDFQIVSVHEALKLEPDKNVNLAVRVLKADGVQTYTKKDQTSKSFFPCLVADQTGSAWLRVYQVHKLTTFAPGTHLLIRGVIKKTGEHALWCPATTKTSSWPRIDIPESVLKEANNNPKSMGSPERKLNEAIFASSPSTVVGKITETSPVKSLRNGELQARFLRLVDDCGPPVKIALFGKEAEGQYQIGDVIKVTEVYPYNKSKSLSTKKQAKVDFLPNDQVVVDVNSVPKSEDPDFKDVQTVEQFEVMGVQSVYSYQCCTKPGCRNKKLLDSMCPTCGQKPSETIYYCSAVMFLKRNNTCTQVRVFMDNLQKLFTLPEDISNSNSLYENLKAQIPVTA